MPLSEAAMQKGEAKETKQQVGNGRSGEAESRERLVTT